MNELIVIKQLPEIEEHLRAFKTEVDAMVAEATSLVCTEETLQVVKKQRAELNAKFKELEAARIAVKRQILAPYEAFEAIYKECVSDAFKKGDMELKTNIAAVEDTLKAEKTEAIKDYFNELCVAEAVENVTFEQLGLQITLSVSNKKLKETVKEKVLKIKNDVEMIRTQEHAEEILVEYYNNFDVTSAILRVTERHKRMEEEAQRAIAAAERKAQEQEAERKVLKITSDEKIEIGLSAPKTEIIEEETEERTISVKIKITAKKSAVKEILKYMKERNINYEQWS